MEIRFDINNKELEVLKDNVQKQFREAMKHFDLSQCNSFHKMELNCDWWNLLIIALCFLILKILLQHNIPLLSVFMQIALKKLVVYEDKILEVGKV